MYEEKVIKLDRIDSIFLWKDSELYKDLKCLECKYISFNPKICSNCEKIYCRICEGVGFSEKTCKHCMKPLVLKEINLSDLEFLNKIELKCMNKDLGCPYIITYKNYITYFEKCLYKRYLCKGKKCEYESTMRNIELHVLSCVYLSEKCRTCNMHVRRIDMEDHVRNCVNNTAFCIYCKKNFPKNKFFNLSEHVCFDNYFEDNCFRITKSSEENLSEDLGFLKKKLFLNLKKLSQTSAFLCKKRKTLFRMKYKNKLKRKLDYSNEIKPTMMNEEVIEESRENCKDMTETVKEKLREHRLVLLNIINKNKGILLNKRKYLKI